jgi:UPF0755 protein
VKKTLIILILIIGLAGLALHRHWQTFFLESASSESGEILFETQDGDTLASVRRRLEAQGLMIDPLVSRIWVRFYLNRGTLKVGEYRLLKEWSPSHILTELFFGKPLLRKLVVKEGDSIWDIQNSIQSAWSAEAAAEFFKLIQDPAWLRRAGVPETRLSVSPATLEGFLFPETYAFQKHDTVKSLIESMLAQFEKRARPILENFLASATFPTGKAPTLYELLTLASVIEKESGNFDEQPIVASVFWNRLNKKMRLQSDPTTIYGLMPQFNGNLTRADLRQSTPFNTYTIPRLPVGPISNPGESALRAVVSPANTDYFYFVANKEGRHVFAHSYAEHSQNVRKFQNPNYVAEQNADEASASTQRKANRRSSH